MKKISKILGVVCISVGIAGCGYSAKSALPSSLKTVYVESFSNKIDFAAENKRNIYFPLLEVDATNAVIDRFLFDGNLRIADRESADLVLTGELVSYNRHVLRYTEDDDVEEYRIQITMDLLMMDTETNEPFWKENGFVGEADYFITGSEAIPESTAVDKAIKDLARRIVERTIENW